MPNPLVECIPNFSEARRPKVVEAILAAVASTGVTVLDHHSDSDHNRTVVTYVGTPEAVEEAAFQAIKKAADLIDLGQHTGARHQEWVAVDIDPIEPFVPPAPGVPWRHDRYSPAIGAQRFGLSPDPPVERDGQVLDDQECVGSVVLT